MSALKLESSMRSRRLLLAAGLLLSSLQTSRTLAAEKGVAQAAQLQSMREIAENFQGQLGMLQRVDFAVVADDSRLVSVRRIIEEDGFLMTFDQDFLAQLSEEEIRAVIAHELGHIWIFTHHPYLQTEDLANRKALQLVPAASLEKVYQRVVHCGGVRQTLPEPAPDRVGAQPVTVRGANASN